MPTPTLISELSTTAASNFPSGAASPADLDDVQRAHASFIAQLRDNPNANSTTATPINKGGTGAITAAAARTALGAATAGPLAASGITGAAASGLVTASGLTQSTARMLGRTTAAPGAVEEISIGAGLTLAAGSLSASGKALVQIQTFQTGALASGSSVWPDDNTIPQISEGDQFMSLAFTPTNVANLLEIDVVFISAAGASSEAAGCGLFRDAVADALTAMQLNTGTGYGVANATFKHVMTAGTTSLITFRVRAGRRDGGALYFNGGSTGVQRYGGVMASRITVKEYLP
jgi:hypothetical protein